MADTAGANDIDPSIDVLGENKMTPVQPAQQSQPVHHGLSLLSVPGHKPGSKFESKHDSGSLAKSTKVKQIPGSVNLKMNAINTDYFLQEPFVKKLIENARKAEAALHTHPKNTKAIKYANDMQMLRQRQMASLGSPSIPIGVIHKSMNDIRNLERRREAAKLESQLKNSSAHNNKAALLWARSKKFKTAQINKLSNSILGKPANVKPTKRMNHPNMLSGYHLNDDGSDVESSDEHRPGSPATSEASRVYSEFDENDPTSQYYDLEEAMQKRRVLSEEDAEILDQDRSISAAIAEEQEEQEIKYMESSMVDAANSIDKIAGDDEEKREKMINDYIEYLIPRLNQFDGKVIDQALRRVSSQSNTLHDLDSSIHYKLKELGIKLSTHKKKAPPTHIAKTEEPIVDTPTIDTPAKVEPPAVTEEVKAEPPAKAKSPTAVESKSEPKFGADFQQVGKDDIKDIDEVLSEGSPILSKQLAAAKIAYETLKSDTPDSDEVVEAIQTLIDLGSFSPLAPEAFASEYEARTEDLKNAKTPEEKAEFEEAIKLLDSSRPLISKRLVVVTDGKRTKNLQTIIYDPTEPDTILIAKGRVNLKKLPDYLRCVTVENDFFGEELDNTRLSLEQFIESLATRNPKNVKGSHGVKHKPAYLAKLEEARKKEEETNRQLTEYMKLEGDKQNLLSERSGHQYIYEVLEQRLKHINKGGNIELDELREAIKHESDMALSENKIEELEAKIKENETMIDTILANNPKVKEQLEAKIKANDEKLKKIKEQISIKSPGRKNRPSSPPVGAGDPSGLVVKTLGEITKP